MKPLHIGKKVMWLWWAVCLPVHFFSWHHNVTCANDSHYHLKELLSSAKHVAEHIFVTCFSLSYFGVVWAVFTNIHLLQKEKPPAWNSISLFKCFCLTSTLWIPNVFECWSFLWKRFLHRKNQTNKKALDQSIACSFTKDRCVTSTS